MPDYERYKREENGASIGRRTGGALGRGKSVNHRKPTAGEKIRASAGKSVGPSSKSPGASGASEGSPRARILTLVVPGTTDTVEVAIRKIHPQVMEGLDIKAAALLTYKDDKAAATLEKAVLLYAKLLDEENGSGSQDKPKESD